MKNKKILFSLGLVTGFILAIILVYNIFVPKAKYQDAETTIAMLKAKITKLQNEPSIFLNNSKRFIKKAQYDSATIYLHKLISEHPGSDEAVEGNVLLSKINKKIANLAKKKRLAKKRLDARLNKYISKNYDKFQHITFYKTKRNVVKGVGDLKLFSIALYFGLSDNQHKYFRLKTKYENLRSDYSDTKWIFYEKVILNGDNGVQLVVKTEYPEKQSENDSESLREWSDNNVDSDTVIKLAQAKSISVRFSGKYDYDFAMKRNQLKAFKEIVAKYQSL